MKKLGFGLMRMPTLTCKADVDVEQTKKMVDMFIENGFTYFDTAWMYHDEMSEPTAKKVLVDRYPRDAFTIASKLHFNYFNSLEGRDEVFNAQRKKVGVDFFDYYLLHGVDDDSIGKYEQFKCFDWIREKKEAGLIRNMGFSFHGSAELLDRILTDYPHMEFVQLQINYLDWDSEWIQSGKCYEVARKHGTPIVIMEPVKGGTLANVPADVEKMLKDYDPSMSVSSWAVRFAASLDGVMMVLSGMSSIEQMQDNISYMKEFKPLNEEEKQMLVRAAEMINSSIAVSCTGCSYCTGGCPQSIPIPQYFSLYNAEMRELKGKWTPNLNYYDQLAAANGKASDCIGCGQCEGVCPQHLPIIDILKLVASHFE